MSIGAMRDARRRRAGNCCPCLTDLPLSSRFIAFLRRHKSAPIGPRRMNLRHDLSQNGKVFIENRHSGLLKHCASRELRPRRPHRLKTQVNLNRTTRPNLSRASVPLDKATCLQNTMIDFGALTECGPKPSRKGAKAPFSNLYHCANRLGTMVTTSGNHQRSASPKTWISTKGKTPR